MSVFTGPVHLRQLFFFTITSLFHREANESHCRGGACSSRSRSDRLQQHKMRSNSLLPCPAGTFMKISAFFAESEKNIGCFPPNSCSFFDSPKNRLQIVTFILYIVSEEIQQHYISAFSSDFSISLFKK